MQNYEIELQKHLIKTFIEDYGRSPAPLELQREINQAKKRMPGLERVGFAGHLITKPQFSSESSATAENKNRQAIYKDINLANHRIEELTAQLENLFRGTYATTRNIKKHLDTIESRIDNVLLLTGNTDAFVYGIEENFTVQDKVDFDSTTASVEAGFCTMGRTGFGLVDLSDAVIQHVTTADKGYIGFQNTSTAESLKEEDGSFWEHLVYTHYKSGRVSLLIDITFPVPQFVSEFRFTGLTGGTTSRMTATVLYSPDGKTFNAVEPGEAVVQTEENLFNIGVDNVKTVRLLLSKSSYDNTTAINGQYVYVFSLDSIKIYSDSYTADGESAFYAGPYDVVDEDGNAVNFTKGTCEVCMSAGDEESVACFLSVDGETYIPVDTTGGGQGVVAFTNSSGTGTEVVLDSTIGATLLIDTTLIELDQNEAVLNTAVDYDYANLVIKKSIVIKRNLPGAAVYGIADGGWFFDKATGLYQTTVYIENAAGQGIDLGSTSAYVNGIQRSGFITLSQGYTLFETTESNWHEVPSGLTNLASLRKADPLYPFNHKLLIEGYNYADTFRGERVYFGVEEYFGKLLTYVPPELFSVPENDADLNIFTLEESEGRLMFKVKVDKSDSTWSNEIYSPSWLVGRGQSNQLWLKMVLSSSVSNASPVITSIKVRVV